MTQKPQKTVRLVMSLDLYEKIKAQAAEDIRTVPKQIIQILKREMGMLDRR